MLSSLRLAILTDEVSQDLGSVLRFARSFRLEGIELRSLFGKAFRELSDAEITEIGTRCGDEGLKICGCASPVFKCDLDSPSAIAEHVELFKRSIEVAQRLECDLVRVFTFLRRGHPSTADDIARAADLFSPLVDAARGSGVRIGVENEASCLVATGAETAEFLRRCPDDPAITVVWDPCNVLYVDGTTDPVRDDYPLIASRIGHVHLKDARRVDGQAADRCVELGKGDADIPEQLRALKEHGYRGWISLETHWREVPLDDDSQHLPAGAAFSANAEPASRICMGHLQRWLAEL